MLYLTYRIVYVFALVDSAAYLRLAALRLAMLINATLCARFLLTSLISPSRLWWCLTHSLKAFLEQDSFAKNTR